MPRGFSVLLSVKPFGLTLATIILSGDNRTAEKKPISPENQKSASRIETKLLISSVGLFAILLPPPKVARRRRGSTSNYLDAALDTRGAFKEGFRAPPDV